MRNYKLSSSSFFDNFLRQKIFSAECMLLRGQHCYIFYHYCILISICVNQENMPLTFLLLFHIKAAKIDKG